MNIKGGSRRESTSEKEKDDIENLEDIIRSAVEY